MSELRERSREGDLLEAQLKKPPAKVYSTGLRKVDDMLSGGLRAGEITLLGGFSGHAKSALAEQIALWQSQLASVLYLPLEMDVDPTRLRMGAKLAHCSVADFEKCGMDPMTRIELNSRRLTLHRPKRLSMRMIEETIRRAKHEIVFVDHVRHIEGVLMSGQGGSEAHVIAHRFPELAKELNVHIVLVQQLDPRGQGRPMREWRFQDSSAFFQGAQSVLISHRPYEGYGAHSDYIAEVIGRKTRWGATAKLHYRWLGQTMSFWEFSPEEIEQLPCCKRKQKKTVADET